MKGFVPPDAETNVSQEHWAVIYMSAAIDSAILQTASGSWGLKKKPEPKADRRNASFLRESWALPSPLKVRRSTTL